MSDTNLRRYLQQMLKQLANIADGRVEDEQLGRVAFEMRLLAEKLSPTSAPKAVGPKPQMH